MAAKKTRARKKQARSKTADPVAIAKRALPKWTVAERPSADTAPARPNATTPSIDRLQRKYHGAATNSVGAAAKASTSKKARAGDDRGGLIMLRPSNPQDAPGKTLSVFVDKGKVRGIQG